MRFLFLNTSLFVLGMLCYNDFFSIQMTTINGVDRSMAEFQGKKILIVILPVTKTVDDSAFLRAIDSISTNYSQQLSIIGIPSVEDGYNSADLNGLRDYYNSLLGTQVTLGLGMYTRKNSAQQHSLFHWLTHKEKNIHFDSDVEGAKQKFFVNEQGELYGVISPEIRLSSRIMDRMMQ